MYKTVQIAKRLINSKLVEMELNKNDGYEFVQSVDGMRVCVLIFKKKEEEDILKEEGDVPHKQISKKRKKTRRTPSDEE